MKDPDQARGSDAKSDAAERDRLGLKQLLLLTLLSAILFLPTLFYPLGRDQGLFAFVADRILEGKLPYRDVWEIKPPPIYLTYAIFQRILGPGLLAVHLPDRLLQILVVLLLATVGARLRGKVFGALACVWYLCLYVRGGYYVMAQPESYATFFGMVGALIYVGGFLQTKRAISSIVLLGVCLGSATAYKPTVGLAFAPFLLFALGDLIRGKENRISLSRRIRLAALLPVAYFLPAAAVVLWMHQNGILHSYLDIQTSFLLPYARLSEFSVETSKVFLQQGLPILYALAVPFILGLIGSSRLLRASAVQRTKNLLLCWIAFSLGSALIQQRLFLYHLVPFFAPFSLLAAEGTLAIDSFSRQISPRRIPLIALLVPLFWLMMVRGDHYLAFAEYVAGKRTRKEWMARFGHPSPGEFYYLGQLQAASFLKEQTEPKDPVFIWGFEPYVYAAARRYPPTRFATNQPVAAIWAPRRWQRELINDLRRFPPLFIVVVHNDVLPLATGTFSDSHRLLSRLPGLKQFLLERYRFVRRIEDYSFYKRQVEIREKENLRGGARVP